MKVLYDLRKVVKPVLKLGKKKNVISRTGLYDLSIFCAASTVYDSQLYELTEPLAL